MLSERLFVAPHPCSQRWGGVGGVIIYLFSSKPSSLSERDSFPSMHLEQEACVADVPGKATTEEGGGEEDKDASERLFFINLYIFLHHFLLSPVPDLNLRRRDLTSFLNAARSFRCPPAPHLPQGHVPFLFSSFFYSSAAPSPPASLSFPAADLLKKKKEAVLIASWP